MGEKESWDNSMRIIFSVERDRRKKEKAGGREIVIEKAARREWKEKHRKVKSTWNKREKQKKEIDERIGNISDNVDSFAVFLMMQC